jgi:hypothetical protein
VVVRAACLELVPVLEKLVCKCLRVLDHLLRVFLPVRLRRLQQRRGNTGDGVVVRTTLTRGEHGVVYALLEVLVSLAVFAEEDETGSRATERFVSVRSLCSAMSQRTRLDNLRRRRHDIAILEGISELLGGDETRCMSDICHEGSPVLVGDFAKRLVIPITGICRRATDDETRFEDTCL